MPRGSSAVSAAPISEPSSMDPVVSIVTWAMSGTSASAPVIARRATDDGRLGLEQVLAGLHDERVRAAREQALGALLVGVAQPRERDMAEGRQLGPWPDRAEYPARLVRGAAALQCSAASLAIFALAWESSKIRSSMPYSPRLPRLAPNELVSTQSTPMAKYASCTARTTSGRVALSISLQPSWSSKSLRGTSWA